MRNNYELSKKKFAFVSVYISCTRVRTLFFIVVLFLRHWDFFPCFSLDPSTEQLIGKNHECSVTLLQKMLLNVIKFSSFFGSFFYFFHQPHFTKLDPVLGKCFEILELKAIVLEVLFL